MSEQNPFAVPETNTAVVDSSLDRDRLRRVAALQRRLNLAVLLQLLFVPYSMLVGFAAGGRPWSDVLIWGYLLVFMLLGVVSVFSLASIFRGRVVAVIYVIGQIVPLLGLLLLLSINGKATKELRAAGIRVGIMGANPDSV